MVVLLGFTATSGLSATLNEHRYAIAEAREQPWILVFYVLPLASVLVLGYAAVRSARSGQQE